MGSDSDDDCREWNDGFDLQAGGQNPCADDHCIHPRLKPEACAHHFHTNVSTLKPGAGEGATCGSRTELKRVPILVLDHIEQARPASLPISARRHEKVLDQPHPRLRAARREIRRGEFHGHVGVLQDHTAGGIHRRNPERESPVAGGECLDDLKRAGVIFALGWLQAAPCRYDVIVDAGVERLAVGVQHRVGGEGKVEDAKEKKGGEQNGIF
nr:hypothetical protein Itr_chr09CG16720 [Ipomoea trifida]